MQVKDVVKAYCADMAHKLILDVNLISEQPCAVSSEYIQSIYNELLKNSMIVATNEQIVIYKRTRSERDVALENNVKSGYWLCMSDVNSGDIMFGWYFSKKEAEENKAKVDKMEQFKDVVILHVDVSSANDINCAELERVRQLKEEFKTGMVVELISMEDEPQMPAGLLGLVKGVDDAGQIHVNWQNGSSLALVPSVDKFIKLGEVE